MVSANDSTYLNHPEIRHVLVCYPEQSASRVRGFLISCQTLSRSAASETIRQVKDCWAVASLNSISLRSVGSSASNRFVEMSFSADPGKTKEARLGCSCRGGWIANWSPHDQGNLLPQPKQRQYSPMSSRRGEVCFRWRHQSGMVLLAFNWLSLGCTETFLGNPRASQNDETGSETGDTPDKEPLADRTLQLPSH